MKFKSNTFFKVIICFVALTALIQSNENRKKNEELGTLKQTVTSLQADISRKDTELKQFTEKQTATDDLKNQNLVMKEEIEKLEKTTNEMNKYVENSENKLASLSKEIIESKTDKVIKLLKNKNLKDLSKYIHPKNGVRLSSSMEIKTDIDIVVDKEQFASLLSDKNKYKWGALDGEGNQIELSFSEYYDKYIYNAEYATKSDIQYNKNINRSEKISNIFEIYSNSIIVEYFFKGTEEENFTNWSSLYLIYDNYKNDWYLSGIAHS